MNIKKIGSIVVALVVVLALIAAYIVWGPKNNQNNEVGVSAVGTLIGMGSTTITIKSSDGSEQTFSGTSPKTAVYSQVAEGAVGRVFAELSVGVNLQVVSEAKDTAVVSSLEIIPLASSTPPESTRSIVSGSIIAITDTSITIEAASNPAMAGTKNDISMTVTRSTQFLTKVLGGEKGKLKSAFVPGAMVNTTVLTTGSSKTAESVELLPLGH